MVILGLLLVLLITLGKNLAELLKSKENVVEFSKKLMVVHQVKDHKHVVLSCTVILKHPSFKNIMMRNQLP